MFWASYTRKQQEGGPKPPQKNHIANVLGGHRFDEYSGSRLTLITVLRFCPSKVGCCVSTFHLLGPGFSQVWLVSTYVDDFYTEQTDAEGWGCELLLIFPPPPTLGQPLKSRLWVLWQHLIKCSRCKHFWVLSMPVLQREAVWGRGTAFGWLPALCPPKQPRPFTHCRCLVFIHLLKGWEWDTARARRVLLGSVSESVEKLKGWSDESVDGGYRALVIGLESRPKSEVSRPLF